MKICVYAICKNEEKNIDNWVKSMSEADDIYVLDTGSTDKSVKLLKKNKVHVKKLKLKRFRFDDARNISLEMVPKDTDIYVCTDLDERFEPGWRKALEENFKDATRASYLYNWSFDENGKPATTFYLNKIHTKDYKWTHPVHEVLTPLKEEKEILIENIVLNHYQERKENRRDYLKLLELSVKEDPSDDRNMHYLGREYMYYKMYDKAIDTLHKHLLLPKSTWKDERCASMRFIARCYKEKEFYEESLFWYNLAIDEAPYLREGYVELAFLEYSLKNYANAIKLLDKAFLIKEKSKSYINEVFAWNYFPYDLYSLCAFYLNKKDIAINYLNKAISLDPGNERLLKNLELINKGSMND